MTQTAKFGFEAMPVSLLLSVIIHALSLLACRSARVVGSDLDGGPTIMVLTFNQENMQLDRYPNVQEILIRSIMDANIFPSLIFFCEQEADGRRLSKLLTRKRGSEALQGYFYNDQFKNKMFGFTKGRMNHQALSMLYNGDATKVTFTSKRKYLGVGKKAAEGKGGIVANVTFEYRHRKTYSVGIGCAHLDSNDLSTRASQLEQMVGFLNAGNAQIQLLSGDLNYRAARMTDVTTRNMLIAKLSSQEGVNDILAHDTLKNTASSLGCTCNQPGAPGALYGPTYKRKPHQPACSQYSGNFPRSKSVIEHCFFDRELGGSFDRNSLDANLTDKTDLKNGEHQMGYLDRLCSCGEAPVEFVYQKGVEEVTVSDHIPVINVVSIAAAA